MRKTQILESDILEIDEYIKNRNEIKKNISFIKKDRRIYVGPHATFIFENYETMHFQIQEMIFIERGGKEQLLDELKAYNPLVPKGDELVATLMFEIADELRRKEFLHAVGGIENKIYIQIADGKKIFAVPEGDTERTNEKGKTSSVHFLHFNFNDEEIISFNDPKNKVLLGFEHEKYEHMTILTMEQRKSLNKDLFKEI